ncbi:hypothetical protein ECC02_007893 [Trypanosoma cruzi]|uniref:Mucin TcMUCII n=1 Tax=Trypanosoma cruzi TaxID=5693 RepID=A0A7J6XXG9_TRYCR|nr:hypothetical protein ECC02_007893 [Trypanosoma cruzi]
MQLRRRLKKEGHWWSMHPRLQCSSAGADLSSQGICARFSLHCLFFSHRNQQVGIRECCGELLLPSPGRAQRRQLHDFGLKGMGLSPDPHRRRMPWTAEKECVPGVVHSSKEKMVLDGARRVDVECVNRASQTYSLEALWAAVATCEYNTFRGKNIFNCSPRRNPMYSGNGFNARSGRKGRTTRTPLASSFISVAARPQRSPRQYALRIFRGGTRCSVCRHCSPTPSVGAEVPVDACSCRFRKHPLIDAAGIAAHCWCFWYDRCTAPSSWWNGTGDENTAEQVQSDGAVRPVSVPPTPAASRETDGTGEESNDCQGNNCFLTSLPVKQPEELTTTSVTNNEKGTATTADSDSSTAVFYTTSHPLRLIVAYGCCGCCGGYQACMKWCALNMNDGQRKMNCFVMNIGCTSRGPTILLVCGDLLFYHCYFAFVLLCALHLLLCVCVPSVRGADTTDRSRRMCMRWSLVCRSCLLLPLPSVCWCCGRAVCVCVRAAVDWSVCRAWCAAYGACLAAALSSCGVPSVCVCRTSRLPCCSPCPSLCRSAPHH